MEIESKFNIPDTESFDRLKELTLIGAYILKEPEIKLVTDTYLDTADGLLRQGGLACRIRHDHARGTWLGTVKGLGGATADLHQREEFEVPIMPSAPPRRWPRSDARDKALGLAQGQPLAEIFTIRQARHLRQVYLKLVHVAELSLDQVAIQTGPDQTVSWELEIELKGQGTLDNLSALKDGLVEFNLQPEPLSKFERAYAANVSIIK